MKKKAITRYAKTREQLANPFGEIPHQELINHSNAVDLRGNHTVIDFGNGRIQVEAIDETKRFFCPTCQRGEYCPTDERIKQISTEVSARLEK